MVRVIAEIGCNHMGDLATAREMVTVAARTCGAHVAKFQKRSNRELLPPDQYDAPHPVPANAFGATYGLHREALEFTVDQHRELAAHAQAEGIGYATSVWDVTSARQMAGIDAALIKVPSATNLHWALHDVLCGEFGGEIHVSTGMTTREDVAAIVDYYRERGRVGDLVLYACTSAYPARFDSLHLPEIAAMKAEYGNEVRAIGYSGHHLGIAIDIAAATLGAEWIERHFTLDRTWRGTDHAASLEPDGLRRLVRDLHAVERAMVPRPSGILPAEEDQHAKLKWRGPATADTAAA